MATHEKGCGLCRIDISNIGVSRDGQEILSNVNLHIHCGQLTALVGQNGAGKTTLIRALLGEIPYHGKIAHLDHSGKAIPHLTIGYVPQALEFDHSTPATVTDFIAAAISKRPVWSGIGKSTKKKIAEALSKVNAQGLSNMPLGKLSGGELQRVMLAMALTPQPDLLVLDEPVSGVDHNGLVLFIKTVLSLRDSMHMAILLVSHDLSMVNEYSDYVVLLDKTVLCAGSPNDVFSSDAYKSAFQSAYLPPKEVSAP